jgi:starch-binding outer membrane protein, SusD/RagB family
MKTIFKSLMLILLVVMMSALYSCNKYLDSPQENKSYTGQTDYTKTENMIQPLLGMYADFYDMEWENYPLIATKGDDVNAGGLGDQQDYAETDKYNYNKDFWMYNSVWQNFYGDIFNANSAIDQIEKYKQYAPNQDLANQYIAEIKTLRGWYYLILSRVWGSIIVTEDPSPSSLISATLTTKDDVMNYISAQMDEAIPLLPDKNPNQRTDIKGGVTKYTALAIKAIANLELKNYQAVAEATGQIISSNKFELDPDFYDLFKLKGKLNSENLLELQYSDFGKGSGDNKSYLFAFFGPQGWTPSVNGAGDGWGFYEPSMKWVKFMLDRNETTRLQTSVMFTDRGIAAIKEDPAYATLPAWITSTTPSGDKLNDFAREMFCSGKQYMPSAMLTPGRTDYGTNKNFTIIRYPEVLLMYAEALTRNATGSAGTAADAVNLVRERAGLTPLASVTSDQVMDEKFAELAMEWGIRYYDMVRLQNYSALSYDGRTFTADKIFLPYPQNQVDLLPALKAK